MVLVLSLRGKGGKRERGKEGKGERGKGGREIQTRSIS